MPRKYLGVIFRRARLCAARFRDRLSLKRTATTVRVNTLLWIYLQSGLVYSDGYIHDIEHGKPAAPSRLDLGKYLVGLGRLELPTSPLSGARSSHLSYRPTAGRLPAWISRF